MKGIYIINILLLLFVQKSYSQCNAVSTTSSFPSSCYGSCDGGLILYTTGGTMPYVVMHPATGSPMTYTSVITIPGLCGGNYTLAIQDAMGCSYTVTGSVAEPAELIVTVSNTSDPSSSTSCDGTGSASVTGGASPYTYNWLDCSTGNAIGITTPNATNLCPGSFAVAVQDVNGCVDTSTCETWISSCTMVSTAGSIIASTCGQCNGSFLLVSTNGTPPYTYYHPVTGTPETYSSVTNVTGLCAGVWTFSITDAAGCGNILVVTIPGSAAPSATLTNSGNPSGISSCDGSGTVTVSGGTSPYTYNWVDCNTGNSTGNTTSTANNLCNGIYAVEVTDANNCVTTTSCVTWNSSACAMVSTVFSPTPSCNNSCNGTIQLASTNGTPPYTFIHPENGNSITYTSTTMITGLCGEMYSVIIYDANGCVNTLPFTINQTSPPSATLTNTGNPSSSSSCDGSGTVNVSGGTSPYAYDWLDCSTDITIGNTQSFSNNLCDGDYYVVVTDMNGCSDTTSCESWLASPCNLASTVSSVNNTSCNGGCDGSASFFTTGGQMPYTYVHPVTGTLITYTSAGYVGGLCAGTWTLYITDANGCNDFLVVTISSPPALVATATIGNNPSAPGVCDGTAVAGISGGTGSYSFNWIECDSMTAIGNTVSTASGLCAGSYAVIITDANGCTDTSSCITLTVPNGILETENEKKLVIFPNPASDNITIIIPGTGSDKIIYIKDISGRIIYSGSNIKDDKITLLLKNMNMGPGIYFIELIADGISYSSKIVYQ